MSSHTDNVIISVPMASNVQDLPAQQTFVEEIDYSEIQELSVNINTQSCYYDMCVVLVYTKFLYK